MGFDKPSDLMFIFAIFALVILTVGLGVQSVQENQNASVNSEYFTTIEDGVDGSFTNSKDNTIGALSGQEGQSESPTEDGIFVRTWNAILDIGETFTLVEGAIEDGSSEIGIPYYFVTIVGVLIIVSFAVVVYSWARGRV